MADCCLIKKVATVEVYENKNEVRAYGFMAGDRNTPVMEVRFKHLWGESNLSNCKLRWIIVDDVGSLLVGEVPIQSDNTALINLPNELFTGDRRMKVQLTLASCDGERILNLQQFTDLKVINNLAANEVVEPVYQILINAIYDESQKYLKELETSYTQKYGSLDSLYKSARASLEEYLITAENGGNAEFLQGYSPANFQKVENTIADLQASTKYKNNDVVKITENGLVFNIKQVSDVGFEDELHFRLANGVYANLYLDASDFSWIIKRQNELVAKYLDINARNLELKITLQGDSITYGHDTVSSDVIAAPTDILPDGSKHSFTRSPRPINISLQKNLREIYGRENITVENRGYSGDYAKRSYERWRTSNNSNITMFLLGQNDSGASYVPEDQRTYNAFYKWNLMLAIREIIRGSAVIFTDGYNTRSNNGGDVRATFMEMNSKIAETIGALFLETSTMLYGCNKTFFSDGVHLNTKGNDRMGARLTPFFVNKQMLDPVKINANDYLGINTDLAQTRANGATISSTSGSAGIITGLSGEDENSYSREVCRLTLDSQALYATFYLCGKSTILNILGGFNLFEVQIDFGNEQAYIEDNYNVASVVLSEYNPLPPSFYQGAYGCLPNYGHQATRIPILGEGWHTVRIRRKQGLSETAYLNGLKFLERTELSTMYIDLNDFKLEGESELFAFPGRDYDGRIKAATEILNKFHKGRLYGGDIIIGKINNLTNYKISHYGTSQNDAATLEINDSSYEYGDMKFYFQWNSITGKMDFKSYFDQSNGVILSDTMIQTLEQLQPLIDKYKNQIVKEKKITLLSVGGGQFDIYTYGSAGYAAQLITAVKYAHSFDNIGILIFTFKVNTNGIVEFLKSGSLIPTSSYEQIDTPYYAVKMQREGIYDKYIEYMDNIKEYEKSLGNDVTSILPVVEKPEMPIEIVNFIKDMGL